MMQNAGTTLRKDDGSTYLTQAQAQTPSNHNKLPTIDRVLFGSLSEQIYERYAPTPPNDPRYAIKLIKASFEAGSAFRGIHAAQERMEMWARYEGLYHRVGEASELPIMERVYAYMSQESLLKAELHSGITTGLRAHLAEVSEFSKRFLLTPDGASRFPHVVTDHEATLITDIIAPLHDLLKFLGTHRAQIIPDHEILTAELVQATFVGQRAILNNQQATLTEQDVHFIASVIGDHENINKEHTRDRYIFSEQSANRAKALFCVVDTLTGVIVPDDSPSSTSWKMDDARMQSRFTNLFFRHIDLVEGKTFRPEWGAFMIRDLCTVLDHLSDAHGFSLGGTAPGKSPKDSLVEAGKSAIEQARRNDSMRIVGPRFTPEQRDRIAAAEKALCHSP